MNSLAAHAALAGVIALLMALAIDLLFGEPPAAVHPVVWMGRYLRTVGAMLAPSDASGGRDLPSFWRGALAWCAGAAIFTLAGWLLQSLLMPFNAVVAGLAMGVLLKPMLAWRMLRREVEGVEDALAVSLDAGRQRLLHLVSRDVTALSAGEVRESAIESLAENLNDSVVAPIFWFAVAGLPGAVLYRFANTADAMWGYRGMRNGRNWEWAGKWAARADDVLSWIPARITALLLALAGRGVPLAILHTEARSTPSPNGGWPMATMALVLGVRLGKPGVYVLNAKGRVPEAADTERAVRLAALSVAACAALAVLAMAWPVIAGAG
ncbi:MAG: cobalamin biosynthesis protein CobD [Comamonadaceae bacterium]|nr:MAG: cobalamin biosynthesis protein CobD [Comamonadaceae bacterium]